MGRRLALDTTAIRDGLPSAARFLGLVTILAPILAACASHHSLHRGIFSSSEYGVPASKRVTNDPNPPHGGGIAMVGQPYVVHGQWYTPQANPVGYDKVGTASWYGWDFHGRLTANGEIFSANAITGGSPDLPLPCYARVTNLDNGRSMLVRFNDRGPYVAGRLVDLSERTAQLLGFDGIGTAKVRVQYVSSAPLNGDDTRYLMASVTQGSSYAVPDNGVRYASLGSDTPRPPVRPIPLAAPSRLRPSLANGELSSVLASVNTLSYAESQEAGAEVTGAHAAVDAMAASLPNLKDWVDTNDADALAVRLDLGTFADPQKARSTAMAFAMLGAVDEDTATTDDGTAGTRLILTHLKPGVGREDVIDLAHKLGLTDAVLY